MDADEGFVFYTEKRLIRETITFFLCLFCSLLPSLQRLGVGVGLGGFNATV